MPFTNTLKLASLTGVASNSTAQQAIPTGGVIHQIYLYVKTSAGAATTVANMKSQLSNIKLRFDGELIVDATPTFLLDMQKFFGDADSAVNVNGVIPLITGTRILETPEARNLMGYGTADVNNISIEVECGTLTTAIDSIDLFVQKEVGVTRNLGIHKRIRKYTQNFTGTGSFEIADLPKQRPNMAYESLHIDLASGTINTVTATVEGTDTYDDVPTNVNIVQLADSGRIAQSSSYYHVPFNLFNEVGGALPMVGITDFRIDVDWATSPGGNFDIYGLQLHGLEKTTI